MHVQPAHAQPRAALDPRDQRRRVGGQQPELRALVAGQDVRVRVGGDARDHAHEHVVRRAGGLEAVDVVGVVDHDQPDPVLGRQRDLLVGLGVAVVDDQRRVDAGLQRGQDLAAAGDVEPEALLDHHALDGRGREGLGGEHDARARPARAPARCRYSRARARSAGSSTTSAGVPNSRARSSARQPPTSSIPSASSALPAGRARAGRPRRRTLDPARRHRLRAKSKPRASRSWRGHSIMVNSWGAQT